MTEIVGNHFLGLIARTEDNLNFIFSTVEAGNHLDADGKPIVFEVTQMINSFLSMLVFPWEVVFKETALRNLTPMHPKYNELGFPDIKSSGPGDRQLLNLGSIIEAMRHGIAHGGITILNLDDFKLRCSDRTVPNVTPEDIAAIEIECKQRNGHGPREWGCILDVEEMVSFL